MFYVFKLVLSHLPLKIMNYLKVLLEIKILIMMDYQKKKQGHSHALVPLLY
jgi:hypothetical protein